MGGTREEGSDTTVKKGRVVFQGVPGCHGTPETPCKVTIQQIEMELVDFSLPTNKGEFLFQNVRFAIDSPFSTVDDGAGAIIPSGTKVTSCGTSNGTNFAHNSTISRNTSLDIDIETQSLGLTLETSLPLLLSDNICEDVLAEALLIAGGQVPWTQVPRK